MSGQKQIDISTILDSQPITPRQWLIIFLGFITLAVDGFDVTAMGFIAPALIDDWQISRHELGPVMMSGLLGLACGSLISGPLADRHGRKTLIVGSVLFFGIGSLISAWSWDLLSLIIFRFLTGLGLGAAMPNITTLVAEYAPKRCRSHMSTAIHCGFNTGAALGGLASERLIEMFGWRSVFLAGGALPLMLTVVLLLYLPESMRFLVLHTRYQQRLARLLNRFIPQVADANTRFINSEPRITQKSAIGSLFHAPYAAGTLAIWATLFIGLFSVYLLSSWLPLMVRDAGLTLSQAVIIGAIFQVGGIAGNFCIGLEMDRWGKHRAIALTLLGGACGALLLGLHMPTLPLLCSLVLLLGFTINGINPGCYALAAHFYPTFMRATGVSWATGIGRLGAISGAGIGSAMLAANWSFSDVFLFLPLPLLFGALAMYLKKQNTTTVYTQ
ncbi:aromatic acid/H+ symport family MFS transporter [Brenneria goodwinii]|uniref:MFS transporter n=1 Tax=Brenneria goodwinii TaxID=1109412 RepID=UPI0036E3DF09